MVEAAKEKIRELTDSETQAEAVEESRAAELLRAYGVSVIEVA